MQISPWNAKRARTEAAGRVRAVSRGVKQIRSQIALVAGLFLFTACSGSGGCTGPAAPKRTGTDKQQAPDEPEDPNVHHVCNICGSTKQFKTSVGRKYELCGECDSKARHRLLAYYLEHETPLFDPKVKLDVLEFGPTMGLMARLKKLENLNYATADLYDERADYILDITKIAQPDESWDYVIAYHMLEHIVDDRKAMSELHRILRPGGKVILQVPLWPDRTEIYEDARITDPKQRKKHFGQDNHVRKYAAAGLQERLEGAGFEVEIVDYLARLDQATIDTHGLFGHFKKPMDQRIWIATKPKVKSAEVVEAAAQPEQPDQLPK
jgi:SAM-dependent methyltransferase